MSAKACAWRIRGVTQPPKLWPWQVVVRMPRFHFELDFKDHLYK